MRTKPRELQQTRSAKAKHTKLPSAVLCGVAALLVACASTSVKQTWKSPDYHSGPITHVAALAVDERTLLRQGFENRLVAQLKDGGATAMTTFDLLSLPEINRDKPAAAERLRSAGAEALLILRLVDAASRYHETRPGSSHYVDYITGAEFSGWYNYYSVAYADFSPTYGNLKQKILLEASLFDLKTTKRVWFGLTETVVTETMDRVAEMDPLVEKIVMAMRKDGVVP
jgi:hypothetical protein